MGVVCEIVRVKVSDTGDCNQMLGALWMKWNKTIFG